MRMSTVWETMILAEALCLSTWENQVLLMQCSRRTCYQHWCHAHRILLNIQWRTSWRNQGLRIRFRTVNPTKIVSTAGEWSITWNQSSGAICAAFPHKESKWRVICPELERLLLSVDGCQWMLVAIGSYCQTLVDDGGWQIITADKIR